MPCTIAVPEERDVLSNVGHAQAAKRNFLKQPIGTLITYYSIM
jgi:hypothetical protein